MKEVCQSLPLSGTHTEHKLLESIPEEDQAALLPIIKLAFPILQWGSLQSCCPSEGGLSMQVRHGIMQMEYQHRLPLSKEAIFSADDGTEVDESLGTSHGSILPPTTFTDNVTQVSERAAPEGSCTMREEKKLLSLGSIFSDRYLAVDACIKNVLACTSSEYSWLQQQEASLGTAFHCGDHVSKRVSVDNILDLSSCTVHKSSESNKPQGGGVIVAADRNGDSKESSAHVNIKRKAAPTYCQDNDVKSKRVKISCHHMAKGVDLSQGTKMRCPSPESMVAMRECSDKLAGTHVTGSAILDTTMEPHKRCRRSNGKQWRCSKNVTPGSMYCELHHQYRSKCRSKKSISPGKACFLEQKRAAFLKERQVNVARCHRTDGKLWQCSKQAVPGSLFCDNHYNRTKKSKKQLSQLRATGFAASENKPIVVEEENVSKLKEGNGLDETSVNSFMKRDGLMQLCDVVAEEGELQTRGCGYTQGNDLETNRKGSSTVTLEESWGRNLTQIFQMADVVGLPGSSNCEHHQTCDPGDKADEITKAQGQSLPDKETRSPNEDRAESTKDSTDDRFAGSPCHREQLQELEQSNNIMSQVVGSLKQCQRKDGKGWQCLKDAKEGQNYCLHHLEYLRKRKTRGNKSRSLKSVANGLPLSDKVSPAICTILNQKESARKLSNKPSLDNLDCSLVDPATVFCKHGHATPNVGSEILAQESSCGSSNIVSSLLADPLSAFCKHGCSTHTLKVATILQESSSVNKFVQKQEASTSSSNPINEINTQHHQLLRQWRSILWSHNQTNCVAHDSSFNEGSGKEEIKSHFDKTSTENSSDIVGDADVACDKGQILHESKRLNGTLLQEISSLKQCQRKDGKYWQCPKIAKEGENYCLHHLVYLRNRRYASKSCRKSNHQIGTGEKMALITGGVPSLCSRVSTSATPSLLPKGLSARKALSNSGAHLTHHVHSGLTDPIDAICSQNNHDCQNQAPSTAAVVETDKLPRESCSVPCKSIQT